MCKVVRYTFSCSHTARLRGSKCGGTYHRLRRSGKSVACSADAYIDIYLRFACGPCQQTEWETSWRQKLEKARTFLIKLDGSGLPGADEISKLVSDLQIEYETASWKVRNLFPPAQKSDRQHTVKVKMGEKVRISSPLNQEVMPDDVVVGEEELSGQDGWEADPSPIETISYDNPIYAIDSDYVDELIAQGNNLGSDQHEESSDFVFDGWNQEEATVEEEAYSLTAWGPDAQNGSSSPRRIDMQGLITEDEMLKKTQTDEVVKLFWTIVNSETRTTGVQSQPSSSASVNKTLDPLFQCLNISDSISDTTGPSIGYTWTDGTTDSPKLTESAFLNDQSGHTSSPSQPSDDNNKSSGSLSAPSANKTAKSTLPRQPSNRNKYDNMRDDLDNIRLSDRTRFHNLWLRVCRWEMTEQESRRREPRTIADPTPFNS